MVTNRPSGREARVGAAAAGLLEAETPDADATLPARREALEKGRTRQGRRRRSGRADAASTIGRLRTRIAVVAREARAHGADPDAVEAGEALRGAITRLVLVAVRALPGWGRRGSPGSGARRRSRPRRCRWRRRGRPEGGAPMSASKRQRGRRRAARRGGRTSLPFRMELASRFAPAAELFSRPRIVAAARAGISSTCR